MIDTLENYPGKNLSYVNIYLADDAWYGENKKPHTQKERKKLIENIAIEAFPNFLKEKG